MTHKTDSIFFLVGDVFLWTVFLLTMNPAPIHAGRENVSYNLSSASPQYFPDSYENDNRHGYKGAQVIVIDDIEPQHHTFHKAGDVDWVKFYGLADTPYRIEVVNPGSMCDPVIELYDTDGTTLLMKKDDYPEGKPESLDYIPPKEGIFYLRVSNFAPDVFGAGTEYDLKAWKPTAPSFAGILTGIVSNKVTKAPIRNAKVKTDHMGSSLSNAKGSYTLIEGQGNYLLSVSAKGYLPFSQGVAIVPGKTTLSIQLTPAGSSKTKDSLLASFSSGVSGTGEDILLAAESQEIFNRIEYSNGLFVAVGDYGALMTSPDGISWTDRISSTDDELYGMTYGNGSYVAVGDYGTILYSGDSSTWTGITSGAENHLYGITHGGNLFVAVGDVVRDKKGSVVGVTILSSPDGITWTDRSFSTNSALYGIAYGNGLFIAIGDRGKILSSGDGNTWKDRSFSTENAFYGITYSHGFFVAVGESGLILTSSDGTEWVGRSADPFYELYGVTYGNGTFVAAGEDGKLLSSKDAVTWIEKGSYTEAGLYGIAYGNGYFVAVGNNGMILLVDAPFPDLTGQWISLAPSCRMTKSSTVCKVTGLLKIQNIGNKDSPSSSVRFYLSDDEVLDEKDIFMKGMSTGKIKKGASRNLRLTYSFQSGQMISGKYIITVIDEPNSVPEINETNNSIVFGPIQ